jgi:hypothetical protein
MGPSARLDERRLRAKRRVRSATRFAWLATAAIALFGCTDVGDSSYVPPGNGGQSTVPESDATGPGADVSNSPSGPDTSVDTAPSDGPRDSSADGSVATGADAPIDQTAAADGSGPPEATTADDAAPPADVTGGADVEADAAQGADAAANDVTVETGVDATADAAAEAGVDAVADAGVDVTVDSEVDAPPDEGADGPADAGADVEVDEGVDAGVEAGSDASNIQNECNAYLPTVMTGGFLVPLHTTCSATELMLYEKSGAAATAPGDCLSCAFVTGSCLDDTFGDTGNDCDDLAGSAQCLAALACDLGFEADGGITSAPSAGIATTSYCGAGESQAQCEAPSPGPTGECVAQITASFPAGFTPTQIFDNFSNNTYSGGIAGKLASCLVVSCGMTCFP